MYGGTSITTTLYVMTKQLFFEPIKEKGKIVHGKTLKCFVACCFDNKAQITVELLLS